MYQSVPTSDKPAAGGPAPDGAGPADVTVLRFRADGTEQVAVHPEGHDIEPRAGLFESTSTTMKGADPPARSPVASTRTAPSLVLCSVILCVCSHRRVRYHGIAVRLP
jgi:hypothetical protein